MTNDEIAMLRRIHELVSARFAPLSAAEQEAIDHAMYVEGDAANEEEE